jgi:polysaccharide pyruvyl transferase WcaK-like protein
MGGSGKNSDRRILLLGYSGFGNFGDDLLLKQAVDKLSVIRGALISIHTPICSRQSNYLSKWFPQARIIRGKLRFRDIIGHNRVLYFGGGVFFEYQRVSWLTEIRRSLSNLRLFCIPKVLFRVRFGGIGLGIGPFLFNQSRRIFARRLGLFSLLFVRDEESYANAIEMGARQVGISPDLSLAITTERIGHDRRVGEKSFGSLSILVCPRSWKHEKEKESYIFRLAKALAQIKQTRPNLKITVFGFQKSEDAVALERLSEIADNMMQWDPETMDTEDVFRTFREHDVVVSARMHGIYVAGLTGKPSVAIGLDPKITSATRMCPRSTLVSKEADHEVMREAICRAMNSCDDEDPKVMSAEFSAKCRQVYDKAIDWIKAP